MTEQAAYAIRVAQLRPTSGHYAAIRYCQIRGVPLPLYTLARVLEAAKEVRHDH